MRIILKLRTFLRNVYRRNDYYSPGKRITPSFAWFIATVVHEGGTHE